MIASARGPCRRTAGCSRGSGLPASRRTARTCRSDDGGTRGSLSIAEILARDPRSVRGAVTLPRAFARLPCRGLTPKRAVRGQTPTIQDARKTRGSRDGTQSARCWPLADPRSSYSASCTPGVEHPGDVGTSAANFSAAARPSWDGRPRARTCPSGSARRRGPQQLDGLGRPAGSRWPAPTVGAPAVDRDQRDVDALVADRRHPVEEPGVAGEVDRHRSAEEIADRLRPQPRRRPRSRVVGRRGDHLDGAERDAVARRHLADVVEPAAAQHPPTPAGTTTGVRGPAGDENGSRWS